MIALSAFNLYIVTPVKVAYYHWNRFTIPMLYQIALASLCKAF
jgi:hypothetical protein